MSYYLNLLKKRERLEEELDIVLTELKGFEENETHLDLLDKFLEDKSHRYYYVEKNGDIHFYNIIWADNAVLYSVEFEYTHNKNGVTREWKMFSHVYSDAEEFLSIPGIDPDKYLTASKFLDAMCKIQASIVEDEEKFSLETTLLSEVSTNTKGMVY